MPTSPQTHLQTAGAHTTEKAHLRSDDASGTKPYSKCKKTSGFANGTHTATGKRPYGRHDFGSISHKRAAQQASPFLQMPSP